MTKALAVSAAALLAFAPLTATADEAVRLTTDKASQSAPAGADSLAVGGPAVGFAAVGVVGLIAIAIASDDDDSDGSTTTSTTN